MSDAIRHIILDNIWRIDTMCQVEQKNSKIMTKEELNRAMYFDQLKKSQNIKNMMYKYVEQKLDE